MAHYKGFDLVMINSFPPIKKQAETMYYSIAPSIKTPYKYP